ncbi:hypothetical protein J2128_001910 [Methanomicrobium sp. W14]|uniref:hypothetical protein n=1 Tax=Methanomicrobium sp. W14 TaxID=2817839 RepID=UPI001AE6A7E4|nr:hypothetical protein [Methanomicrobium sp. W14]MBP2133944.1 hypothetical protein [Methanomicrobium sp. W14]
MALTCLVLLAAAAVFASPVSAHTHTTHWGAYDVTSEGDWISSSSNDCFQALGKVEHINGNDVNEIDITLEVKGHLHMPFGPWSKKVYNSWVASNGYRTYEYFDHPRQKHSIRTSFTASDGGYGYSVCTI